ncbi:MAG: hypothetical protein JRF17_05810 [Deltaproteobacteria bacterium]|nr:hypothetical protein [Deltaproteobacteria bacterium]
MKDHSLFLIVLIIVILSFVSCRSLQDKPDEVRHITITLNYDLEKVYSAAKFILINTKDRWIQNYSEEAEFIQVKAINLKIDDRRDIEIYFDPSGKRSTKVKFIITQILQAKMAVKRLINELQYYLENDEEAYTKYTKNEALKRRVRGFQ